MTTSAESPAFDVAPWAPSVRAYADWIDERDRGTAHLWARRLNSTDEPEAPVLRAGAGHKESFVGVSNLCHEPRRVKESNAGLS